MNVLDHPEASQYDIGNFTNLSNVTDEVKYNLLTNHFKPDSNYKFPVKFLHGSDRYLNFHWLIEYPFLVYSKINDSVCCLLCVLFGENNKNKLAKLPGFSKWHTVGDKNKSHVNNGTHSTAMTAASVFKERIEKPSSTSTYGYDNQKIETVQHNREILKWVIKTIELCGKQCIAFRGHRENVASKKNNCGNFLAILKLLAQTNDDLQNHLASPVAKNATYLSPKIQNEIINIIGYDILQADFINEIKEAKFFSILAVEVESHKVEQLPICIRFADKNNNIREEFLEFGRCEQLSGKVIANEIIRVLGKSNLDIKNCRGQGYEGVSNMSSEAVGVQKQIKKILWKNSLHSLLWE